MRMSRANAIANTVERGLESERIAPFFGTPQAALNAGRRPVGPAARRSGTIRAVTPRDAHGSDDRFDWHPEPGLVGFHDEAAAREALERLGSATWSAALDWLY